MSVLLFMIVAAVLFGLVRSTHSLLEIRQSRRERGVDSKAWL